MIKDKNPVWLSTLFFSIPIAIMLLFPLALTANQVDSVHLIKKSHSHSNLRFTQKAAEISSSPLTIDSAYRFEGDITDEVGEYAISLKGKAEELYIERDASLAFNMPDRSWLEFSQSLHSNIQTDKSLSLSLDFYFKNTGEDESVRVLLSNKDWAYDVLGLKITAFNEKTAWQPEGIIFLQFNIGVGTREVATRFFDLPMNTWHTASVDLDFSENTVSFGVNGRKDTKSLSESEGGEAIDPTQFINSLTQTPFRIGTHQSNEGEEPAWRDEDAIKGGNTTTSNLAEVYFDNVLVQSPKVAGDVEQLKATLNILSSHLEGKSTLSEVELESQLLSLRQNLNGTNLADFSTEAKRFIDAHGEVFGAIYKIQYRFNLDNVVYDELPAVSKAYVDLGVWILDEGLTTENTSSAEGITLIEHNQFPGALPENAQRIEKGVANIRAQYVRDPGYLMGGMKQEPDSELAAYLYRPTGYYAPAGEIVSVTVDPKLVNSGLHIRVGAHADNHMVLASTSRFPVLSADFRIESETTKVINPLGGNIYVLVPQDTDLGWTEVEFSGAVRAPYFSTRTGQSTAEGQWENIKQYPGLFTDFESDKFMITVPTAQLQSFEQPVQLLDRWDQIMDVMQVLHGRPLERSRAEAYLLDATQVVIGSFPGGYPVTPGFYAEGDNGITDGYYSPFAALNEGNWEEDGGFSIMLHELGHHHFGRFLNVGEQESYVNVPMAAVLNDVYDLSFDDALKYSGYQLFTRTDAAIDWMVTYNFRNGSSIGFDPTTDFEPIETSYQARGHAKYVDLADIFNGWEALGAIYEVFYQEDLVSGTPPNTQVGISHDEFLQKGSTALECNLASLFHFWGIHPSADVASKIGVLPPCDGALERVLHYLESAPRTNEDLRAFHTEKTAVHANQLKYQVYDQLLVDFDTSYGQQIRNIGAEILSNYFGISPDGAPSQPVVNTTTFEFDTASPQDLSFSWSEAVDPEGKDMKYSWKLILEETKEVLFSRTWLDTNSIVISGSDLAQVLQPYLSENSDTQFAQVVTTADAFTVVQSEKVVTTFNVSSSGSGSGGNGSGSTDSGTGTGSTDSGSSNSSSSESSGGGGMFYLLVFLMLSFARKLDTKG